MVNDLGFEFSRGNRLYGRRILVVGAGQRASSNVDSPLGNGRAISLVLARHGAAIVCADKSVKSADETCKLIRDEGGRALVCHVDLEDELSVNTIIHRSRELIGEIDGLVLVAGTTCGISFSDLTYVDWERTQKINVSSQMEIAKSALKTMQRGGSIVLLSSIAAFRCSSSNPAYEVSKAAQLALTRSIAMAGQGRLIRCNSVVAGLIDTPMGRDESFRRPERLNAPLPFGRQGTASEVAYACLFLISEESSYVNGHALVVDGGISVGIGIRSSNLA